MISLIRGRNGSSPVFLSIILAALMAITLSLVYSARQVAVFSVADGTFNLAGNSVLSEYDYYIERDYGLFLIQGTNEQLSRKLQRYAGNTLDHPDKIKLTKASVNAGRFNATSLTAIKQQIQDHMKSLSAVSAAIKHEDKVESSEEKMQYRTLRHGPTITSLPSRALPDKNILAAAKKIGESLKNPELFFRSGTSKYIMDSYILHKFNNNIYTIDPNHFFSNEVEYIICGGLSDEKNGEQTDMAIKAIRVGLNLQHIYTNPEKTAAVQAAAEILTPGILGTVTQLGISTVWATAEAANDVALLHEGYKVPIIKDKLSWAIDLDALIEGYNSGKAYVAPAVNKGREYEDYLRILLFIKDDNMKTGRILDLIQINMRKNYDKNFLVQECATGISIDGTVNGKDFTYDKMY
ncbi:MAG: DUF5702 domain-containing protein [Eubacteriales bacterium]|nr:DUF5702 domain-containing protein [Eubacteriales bacterium]